MQLTTRTFFTLLAVVSLGLLGAGLALGELLHLQPCYLCNVQRLIYIVLAVVAVLGVLLPHWGRLWALLAALVAMCGVLAAAQQSWMQFAPQQATECGFGEPTFYEQMINWLGGLWPQMFMVTGFCTNKEWVFLGLSLANWSGLCFAVLFGVAVWQFFRRCRVR